MTDPNTATIQDALTAATRELSAAGLENFATDARRLLAHALQIAPDRLTLLMADPMPRDALGALDTALKARLDRQPVSHILGKRAFWGRDFKVTPAVLDPRPETETLIDIALQQDFKRVLDLGTGSGCILLTLLAERPGSTGMGLEFSEDALKVAVENRTALGLDRQAIFAQSDWFERAVGQFDLIVANPPYIAMPEMPGLAPEVLRWEPMSALTPGMTGLEAYHAIAEAIVDFLTPDGRVLLEIGPTQGQAVSAIFTTQGLTLIAVHPDLDGRDRVVELRLSQ
jgi:release factor glutamine methyltransferase